MVAIRYRILGRILKVRKCLFLSADEQVSSLLTFHVRPFWLWRETFSTDTSSLYKTLSGLL